MARNTSVSLSDHFVEFIEEKVKDGRYTSASDVVRAGLRLLEAEEAKLEQLRAMIDEGVASGPAQPFDFEAFLARKNANR
jgi:antitoxin ParD1/3/4